MIMANVRVGAESIRSDNVSDVIGPDQRQVEARAYIVSHLLQAHGGGIEVIPSGKSDVVRLRFTGLCTACSLRPLTVANIVKPVFENLDGVRDVEIEGCRISSEAMESLAAR
jgi:Fe-S cluster biogenesis protein NfuA